ncbi:HEAT repeat domain-containing protein [Sunxiuqinia elliptica]
MMKHISFLLILFLSLLFISCGKEQNKGFAIVIDSTSYRKAQKEVEAYANAIEQEGLKTYLIIDQWQHPDSIRNRLLNLYTKDKFPIEGAVFIGAIPVPMLRDAQHLSTAFKMDQNRYKWSRSSIPSDRFYDDFDLQFSYLKQDTTHSLYHYYSLTPESPQELTVDIYTARIKPKEGKDKYDKLKAYLSKVVAYKQAPRQARQVLFFTGHGYNSEAPRAYMDEKIAISQQFSHLEGQKNWLEYVNFSFDTHIKFRLMSELKRNNLDIALLHHHGGTKAQYLNGMPETSAVKGSIENIKYYLRSKLSKAGTSKEKQKLIIERYQKYYGVPEDWFEGTFDTNQIRKDSIFNANLDIYVEDMKGYTPNAKFIMLDACFTGSFHQDTYLAGEYIFSTGNTIVAQANSVNVFQDKWPNEMVGLIGLGLRVGHWNKMTCTLETHLLGDPTFAFQSPNNTLDINHILIEYQNDLTFWKNQLNSEYADVQALALRMLFDIEGSNSSSLLLEKFETSPFFTVRAEAFKLLSFCRDANFVTAINLGVNDSYELIQRLSALYLLRSGDESHIPFLIEALLRNNLSKRVNYNLRNAISAYSQQSLTNELEKQIDNKEYLLNKEDKRKSLQKTIDYNTEKAAKYVDEILATPQDVKNAYFNLRAFRNITVHSHLDKLISYTDTVKNKKLKLAATEMLGWFKYSSKRNQIIDFCESSLQKEEKQNIKSELTRTLNRIKIKP